MRGKRWARFCFRPVAANQSGSIRGNSSFVFAEVEHLKRLMFIFSVFSPITSKTLIERH